MHESNIVLVPDYGGAGPRHWRAHWRSNHPRLMRFTEHDPSDPSCRKWLRGIDDAVSLSGPRTTVVAQGLGCLALAHWAQTINAAMLVSVADPSSERFPKHLLGFSPVPRHALQFRTLIVASESEGDYRHALNRAHDWDASMVVVGRISDETVTTARQTWDEGLGLLWNLAGLPVTFHVLPTQGD